MMDKDYEQYGSIQNQMLSPYLLAGAKVTKEISTAQKFEPEGNPHTIVVVVRCRQGTWAREVVTHIG